MSKDGENLQGKEPAVADAKSPGSKTLPKSAPSSIGFAMKKILLGLLVSVGFVGIILLVLFHTGSVENYVLDKFTSKMDRSGISFKADRFDLTTFPIRLRLGNAEFKNKATGELLLSVKDADIHLSIRELFSLKVTRDISVDKVEIDGIDIFLSFDANGRSNFSGVGIVEDDDLVKVTYKSSALSVQNGRFIYGDEVRNLDLDLSRVELELTPKSSESGSQGTVNEISLKTGTSSFRFGDGKLDDIVVDLLGTVSDQSFEVSKLSIRSSAGKASLSGSLSDFDDPKYDFEIDSTLEITSLARAFAPSIALNGSGVVRGRLTGRGSDFKFEGIGETDSLLADGFSLKSLDLNASYEGRSDEYVVNGTAVAEALTFGSVQIDLPRLAGMIRGTGSDFDWIGELQALAVKTGAGTIGGLFLRDASLQNNQRGVSAKAGRVEFGRFVSDNLLITGINGTGFSLSTGKGSTDISVSLATANDLRTGDVSLSAISAGAISIRDDKSGLIIGSPKVSARKAAVGDLKFNDLESGEVSVVSRNGRTVVDTDSLSSREATIGPFSLEGVRATGIEAIDDPKGLVVYSRGLQTARISTDAISLGVVDVAGVRLRIFKGTVEFTTDEPVRAGNVALKSADGSVAGNIQGVTAERLIYVVDPSGAYRATADISLGGGSLGRLNLGSATAKLEVTKERVSVQDVNANILGGRVQGLGGFALEENAKSNVSFSFSDLQASELFTLFGGIAPPITSSISGTGEFTFKENDFTTSSGTLNAQSRLTADVGTDRIPLTGEVRVSADNGVISFQRAQIETRYSIGRVEGRLDISDLSANLQMFLEKKPGIPEGNANEVDSIVRPLISKTEIGQWATDNRFEAFGDLDFKGDLSGQLSNPDLDGTVAVTSISLRGKLLGSFRTSFTINPDTLSLKDGILRELDGGQLSFSALIPRYGENNIDVSARLSDVDFGSLLVVIPYDFPPAIRSIAANTSGRLDVTGLPGAMIGSADITAREVVFGLATFDRVETTARFSDSTIDFQKMTVGFGQNSLEAPGSYDILSTDFNFNLTGKQIPLGALYAFMPPNSPINEISGTADLEGRFKGRADDPSTFDVDFQGKLTAVTLNKALLGDATLSAQTTANGLDIATMPIDGGAFPSVTGRIVLNEEGLPFSTRLVFNKSPLEPIFNLFPLPGEDGIKGTISGTIELQGELASAADFPVNTLKGTASINQMDAQLPQTSISAARPFTLSLANGILNLGDRSGIAFTGGGSDLVVSGSKAIDDSSENNVSLRGRLNLGVINAFLANTFLSGIANVDMRITGPNSDEILNGSAALERASLSTFVSTERITLDQLTGRINFTSNRVDINSVRGNLGGGKVSISGIATLLDDFRIERLILNMSGERVRVPFPRNFQTVGNANLRIDTERNGSSLRTVISGRIVPQRALYETDIDLADVTSGRRESGITQSGPTSSLGDVILDLSVEGRNALEVRNNLADLTASLSLRVTGDVGAPQISGRVTSNSGIIFFRRDRYEIQRAELLFPPQSDADPSLNLQAVAEIRGYQVIVALNGVLSDAESLNLSVRSNPSLPQADVISLITTGSLANTESGIPTVAQSGISTAAEVLTNEIINKPVTRATDKLFGLNRFELDPIISGSRLNPTARLTVGRQINRDLAVTYSTNLSDTQNQVVAFEYRVSNRISFVAQYEQRELSNVTRQSNNFSFEVRLRKRF